MSELDGRRRIGEGREAEIFEWDGNTVLRLLRSPGDEARVAAAAAAMRSVAECGIRVPEVHELVTIDGRAGIVMERIDGPDLFAVIARQPWRLVGVARQLSEIHARLHGVAAPEELPPLRPWIRARIESSDDVPERFAAVALHELDSLPDGDRVCHGDFHPGNLLLAPDGAALIDWSNATRGDPMADLARTKVMLELAAPPDGTGLLVRKLDRFGRGFFARAYLRGYERARAVDWSIVDRWVRIRAVDRLTEGIDEEVPALLARLERAVRPAG